MQTDTDVTKNSGIWQEWRSSFSSPSKWQVWHNFPQKLGALIAAIALWFAATADRRVTIQRAFDVPLLVRGQLSQRVVSNLPKTIRVTLEGNRTRLEPLSASLVEASVDVSGLGDGFFSRQVTITQPDALRVMKLEPARVSGNVDAVVSEKIDVRTALLETNTKPKLRIKTSPLMVKVIGSRPLVERVAYALALATRQITPNKTFAVRLTPMDSENRPVEGVRLEPTRVKIGQ